MSVQVAEAFIIIIIIFDYVVFEEIFI